MNELLHHECLMRLPAGYALFSPQDDGTDFRLIEANGAFERALGASAARLESLPLAQAVREGIFPAGLLAALPRSLSAPLETELYVPNTNRWFKACLFSPKAGFTAALLTDITSDKKAPLLEEQSLTMALQEAPSRSSPRILTALFSRPTGRPSSSPATRRRSFWARACTAWWSGAAALRA